MTAVDDFWASKTVRDAPFTTAAESLNWLEQRALLYPFFHELMGLWGDHHDDIVLDYGCGPANDLVGFLVHGQAKRAIGVDVSERALSLARQRLGLHAIEPERLVLLQAADDDPTIALPANSVDYIYSEGVLHHTSHPQEILREFYRVLRPGGQASVMVYNADSLWFHLWVAYELQVVEGRSPELSVHQLFRTTTDGPDCPISRAYRPDEFLRMLRRAKFDAAFVGGYLCQSIEGQNWRGRLSVAQVDDRLGAVHRDFLGDIEGNNGLPYYRGLPAGIGGVYRMTK